MLIQTAGDSARFAWEEFFYGRIRSEHTRRAYFRSVRYFLAWCEDQNIILGQISPAHVGLYMDRLQLSTPSKKQVLAEKASEKNFYLIVDEINRGDIPRILVSC